MSEPTHRVKMSSGDQWDDPSEDALFMFLEAMVHGDEYFLILEALSDPTKHTYAQTYYCPADDGSCPCTIKHDVPKWDVERREGDASQHFHVATTDLLEVHTALVCWMRDSEPTIPINWQPMTFDN